MISIRDLWKRYGRQVVLERINLDVAPRSFCTIVGASGCGKSTLLRLLLGEEAPTAGTISVDGRLLPAEPGPERGVVFQRYSVFPHMTVRANAMLGLEFAHAPLSARLFGHARARAEAETAAMLRAVGLWEARDAYPGALSGGMQQRLAIAQALLRRPKILLLDEPFGALDPGTRTAMHELILGLWREHAMTVFMVTHDLSEGFRLGTRVLVLDKPRIDPDDAGAYGATVTYDLDLGQKKQPPPVVSRQAEPEARSAPAPAPLRPRRVAA